MKAVKFVFVLVLMLSLTIPALAGNGPGGPGGGGGDIPDTGELFGDLLQLEDTFGHCGFSKQILTFIALFRKGNVLPHCFCATRSEPVLCPAEAPRSTRIQIPEPRTAGCSRPSAVALR